MFSRQDAKSAKKCRRSPFFFAIFAPLRESTLPASRSSRLRVSLSGSYHQARSTAGEVDCAVLVHPTNYLLFRRIYRKAYGFSFFSFELFSVAINPVSGFRFRRLHLVVHRLAQGLFVIRGDASRLDVFGLATAVLVRATGTDFRLTPVGPLPVFACSLHDQRLPTGTSK